MIPQILNNAVTKFSWLTIECCLITNQAALMTRKTWAGMASNAVWIAVGILLAWLVWCIVAFVSKKPVKSMEPKARQAVDSVSFLLFFYWMTAGLLTSIINMPMVWVSWAALALCLIFFVLRGKN